MIFVRLLIIAAALAVLSGGIAAMINQTGFEDTVPKFYKFVCFAFGLSTILLLIFLAGSIVWVAVKLPSLLM